MLSTLALFTLVSLALDSVAVTIPGFHRTLAAKRNPIPATYAEGYLEDYHVYNTRYLALDCQDKHDTTFFADCCHPMLATETLETARKPYCKPSESASKSAASVEPTSTPPSTVAAAPAAAANVAADPGSNDNDDSSSSSSSSSSSKPAAPSPTPEPKAAPKPKPAPAKSSGGGAQFSGGFGTFFFQNGVAGACGTVHPDSAMIVALPTNTYAGGSHCGKSVTITDSNSGKTQSAVVADECPTCDNDACLDMSVALFTGFAAESVGQIDIKWSFD